MPDEIIIKVSTAADLAAAKEAKSTLDQLAASNKAAEAAAKSRADSSLTISAAEDQAIAKTTESLEAQLVAWRELKAEREANIKITGSHAGGDGLPVNIAMGDPSPRTPLSEYRNPPPSSPNAEGLAIGNKFQQAAALVELDQLTKLVAARTKASEATVVQKARIEQLEGALEDYDKYVEMTIADNKALATSVASVAEAQTTSTAAAAAFTISTEAEYLAIKKAHDAISAKLPVMKAAGVETVALEATQAKYATVLASSSAIQIRDTIAEREAALVKKQLAEAALAAAAGQHAETGATHGNTVAMREAMVITRELMSGNVSRTPGSLGLLLSSLGLKGAGVLPALTAASVGFFAIEGIFRKIKESTQEADKAFEDFMGQAIHVPGLVGDLNGVREMNDKISESAYKFHLEIQRIMKDTNVLQTQMANTTNAINAQFAELTSHETGEINLLNTRIELMRTLGLINDDQAAKEKAQTALQDARNKMDAANKTDEAAIAAKQKEIDDARNAVPAAEAAYDAANKVAENRARQAENTTTNLKRTDDSISDLLNGTPEFAEQMKGAGIALTNKGQKVTKAAAQQEYIQSLLDSTQSPTDKMMSKKAELPKAISDNLPAIVNALDKYKNMGEGPIKSINQAVQDLAKDHPEAAAALYNQSNQGATGQIGNAGDTVKLIYALQEQKQDLAKITQLYLQRSQLWEELAPVRNAQAAADIAAASLNTTALNAANVLTPENLNALQQQKDKLYGNANDPLRGKNDPIYAGEMAARQTAFDKQFRQAQLTLANESLKEVLKTETVPQIVAAGTSAIDKIHQLNNLRYTKDRIDTAAADALAKRPEIRTDRDNQMIEMQLKLVEFEKGRENLLNLIRALGEQGAPIADIIRQHAAVFNPDNNAGTPGLAVDQDKQSLAGEQYQIIRILESIRLELAVKGAASPDVTKPSTSGLPGFADGGYTGDGHPDAVAGIVHKGEIVVPSDVVAKYKNKIPSSAAEWAEFDAATNGWRDDSGKSQSQVAEENRAFYAKQASDDAKTNGWLNPTASEKDDFYEKQREADAVKNKWNIHMSGQEKDDFYKKQAAADAAKNGWKTTTEAERDAFYKSQAASDKERRDKEWEQEFGGADWQAKAAARKEASAVRVREFHRDRGDIDNGDGTWTSPDHKKTYGTPPSEDAQYHRDFPAHRDTPHGSGALDAAHGATQSVQTMLAAIQKTLAIIPDTMNTLLRSLAATNEEVAGIKKTVDQGRMFR